MRSAEHGTLLGRFWILRSPVFLVSLALLVANDLYLKAAYPGWFTGKLSDFSGLLVFSLFLFPLVRVGAAKVASAVAIFFIWWKSPYSSFAIELVNGTGLIAIGRVVDYSDLIALVVLPLSMRLYNGRQPRRADLDSWRQLSLISIGAVTLLAIMGTSSLNFSRPVEMRASEGAPALSEADIDVIVASLFDSRKDECRGRGDDNRMTCVIDGVWFAYVVTSSSVMFDFEQSARDSPNRVNKVIESLKAAFTRHAVEFTYIEPLIDPEEAVSQ